MTTPPRVLLAYDHTLVLEGFRRIVEQRCEVVGAVEDGRALLEAAMQLRPDLILLDLNMPRMNGLEMLAELRNDPVLSSAVVFVLTTSKADEDIVVAYQQHVAGYIVKSQVGDGFLRIMGMLDHYWRVVELPVGV